MIKKIIKKTFETFQNPHFYVFQKLLVVFFQTIMLGSSLTDSLLIELKEIKVTLETATRTALSNLTFFLSKLNKFGMQRKVFIKYLGTDSNVDF